MPGRGELDIDTQRAEHQQQQRDIRIGNGGAESARAQRGLDRVRSSASRSAASVCAPSKRVISRPSSCLQQRGGIGRDEIDQMLIERLPFGVRNAFAHGLLGRIARCGRDASRCVRISAAVSFSTFCFMMGSDLARRLDDRMRCAGIGSGRHGRHVAGFQKEEAGRCRARAGRPDPHDDGNRRVENLLHDLARGVHQTAGRAEPDDHGVGMLRFGLIERGRDHFHCDRVHNAVHIDLNHARGERLREPGGTQGGGNRKQITQAFSL